MLALLGGKAESGQKHPIIYSFGPLIKDFNLSELLISSILAVCFICSRVFLMEFNRFHQFGSLLLNDDFVLSYSGYVTEDILEAVGTTLRQRHSNLFQTSQSFFHKIAPVNDDINDHPAFAPFANQKINQPPCYIRRQHIDT